MKVILFLTLLLSFPLVLSAPNFIIQNEAIQPGETIFGKIEIENATFSKEIQTSDISFFQGRKEVFFEHDILYYEGIHYFYAYAVTEGNFTIKISNILYTEDGLLKSAELEKEISVKTEPFFDEESNKTYTQIIGIKPGFVFGVEDLKITLTNNGNERVNFTYSDEEISLDILESKELTISKKDKINYFEISSYKDFKIPAIDPFYNGTLDTREELDLRTPTKILELQLTRNEETKQLIEFYNFGDGNITDITFTSNAPFVKFEGFSSLDGREIKNLTVLFTPENLGRFQGEIFVNYLQYGEAHNFTVPFSGIVLPKGENISTLVVEEKTCSEVGGSVCSETQVCTGESGFTKGVIYCCFKECIEVENPDSEDRDYGVLIGVLILLGLAGVGFYFYKRSKKFNPKSATEKITESSKKFEERMKPEKPKRISGGLDRV